jgi:hypothetical protein
LVSLELANAGSLEIDSLPSELVFFIKVKICCLSGALGGLYGILLLFGKRLGKGGVESRELAKSIELALG